MTDTNDELLYILPPAYLLLANKKVCDSRYTTPQRSSHDSHTLNLKSNKGCQYFNFAVQRMKTILHWTQRLYHFAHASCMI